MLKLIQKLIGLPIRLLEKLGDLAFGDRLNPFNHLGGLAFFMFWLVALSGVYLYIFFETSTSAAYASIEVISNEQWYIGVAMRGLHRYASDAMVLFALLHLMREFSLDRYRGARWFSWFSGVPLLWLLYASGIGGYWLVWDRMAQYIAQRTAEWLDWLGIFGEPMAVNFINNAALGDRFFSLLAFLHIGIPLALLLAMWVHIQRISNARSNPPRRLMWGSLLVLLVLSLVVPAVSQAPADLDSEPLQIALDWFFLAFYPLIDIGGPVLLWGVALGASALLVLLPWLPCLRTVAAKVDLQNCNGCGRCFDDCPYNAITMAPRSDGLPYSEEALVEPGLCVACGICVGSCPTATPFRRARDVSPGIDMPDRSLRGLRDRIATASAALQGEERRLVFCCDSVMADYREVPNGASIAVPCVAAIPPAFIDFVLARGFADKIYLATCAGGACNHRLGIEWMEGRIAGTRDPRLRKRVPRDKLVCLWGPEAHRLRRELLAGDE